MKKVLITLGLIAVMSSSVFAYGLELGGLLGGPTIDDSIGLIIPIDNKMDVVVGFSSISDNYENRGAGESGAASQIYLKGLYTIAKSGAVTTHSGLSLVSVSDKDGIITGVKTATIISGILGVDIAIAEGFNLILDAEVLVLSSGTDAAGDAFSSTTLIGSPSIGLSADLPW